MLVALIAPVPNLELTQLGDIHMVLTQLVDNLQYRQFYKNESKYKILDNGAFEGTARHIEFIVVAAELVGANEIILPDIVYDCEATIDSAKSSLAWLRKHQLLGKYKTMAVPQADTESGWWHCFNELNQMEHIDVIGFSKLSCPKCFNLSVANSRIVIAMTINENGWWNKDKEYHLLGSSHMAILEIDTLRQYKQIRSIDTSAPIMFGNAGFDLCDKSIPKDLLVRDLTEAILQTEFTQGKIKDNIQHLLDAAHYDD